ncbi:MAG: GreA/GreB family elongation factor, partial [Candidatus Aureabacteria bacterium]|nr:GreA/GreB family elongation factor [Candidatus Auribacterota bacterium]
RILVSSEEIDFEQGKISIYSPVGKGLLGHKEGDIVDIEVSEDTLKYEILKITRP